MNSDCQVSKINSRNIMLSVIFNEKFCVAWQMLKMFSLLLLSAWGVRSWILPFEGTVNGWLVIMGKTLWLLQNISLVPDVKRWTSNKSHCICFCWIILLIKHSRWLFTQKKNSLKNYWKLNGKKISYLSVYLMCVIWCKYNGKNNIKKKFLSLGHLR